MGLLMKIHVLGKKLRTTRNTRNITYSLPRDKLGMLKTFEALPLLLPACRTLYTDVDWTNARTKMMANPFPRTPSYVCLCVQAMSVCVYPSDVCLCVQLQSGAFLKVP